MSSSWVPPQHGAWAFLGLPLALGAVVTPWSPLLIVLAVAWVAAYPASYAALGMARSKRRSRFRYPLLVWGSATLIAGIVLLWWRPWLLWVGIVYAALFTVNVVYARRNDERAIVNDLVFIAECALITAVVWMTATGDRGWQPPTVPDRVWILTALCALVLTGSTLHVKSLIRERRDPRYTAASRTFAVLCIPAGAVLAFTWGLPAGWWLLLPFVALAVRSFIAGRSPMRPGVIGMIELACFILGVVGAVLASL